LTEAATRSTSSHAGDQVLVQPAGEQVPGGRVAAGEVGSRPGAVEGDLAQVPDARGQLEAHQVEQREVRERRAVGVGGVLGDNQVGLVAQDGQQQHCLAPVPVGGHQPSGDRCRS
jgi:hypothetical protein